MNSSSSVNCFLLFFVFFALFRLVTIKHKIYRTRSQRFTFHFSCGISRLVMQSVKVKLLKEKLGIKENGRLSATVSPIESHVHRKNNFKISQLGKKFERKVLIHFYCVSSALDAELLKNFSFSRQLRNSRDSTIEFVLAGPEAEKLFFSGH